MSGSFFSQYGGEIATLTLEHLWLTGSAMLFATAIAVPAGIALTRGPLHLDRAAHRGSSDYRAHC